MRRSLSVRIAALVFVTFMATAPAFASPRRDDSPNDDIGSTITRLIDKIIQSLDLSQIINPPK